MHIISSKSRAAWCQRWPAGCITKDSKPKGGGSNSDFWERHAYPSETFFSYNAPLAINGLDVAVSGLHAEVHVKRVACYER